MEINDLFFQIVMLLVGGIIGVLAQLIHREGLKRFLLFLTILLIIVPIVWVSINLLNLGKIPNHLAEDDGLIWDATFYGNKELKPPIVLSSNIKGARNGLRVDWEVNSPRKQVPVDFFSGLFVVKHNFSGGLYCFTFEVDDGGKLFIDGEEIYSAWWGYTPGAVYKTKVMLDEGPHTIQFAYYEEFERAAFHLSWYNEGVGSECVTVGHPGIQ